MRKIFTKIFIAVCMALVSGTTVYAEDFWWGYCSENIVDSYGAASSVVATNGGIYVPAELAQAMGNRKIKGIGVYCKNTGTKLTGTIMRQIDSDTIVSKLKGTASKDVWNEIIFDEPCDLDVNGFYVKVSVKGKNAICYTDNQVENANLWSTSTNAMEDYSSERNALAIRILLEDNGTDYNDVSLEELGDVCKITGEAFSITGKFLNKGSKPVTSIDFKVTMPNGESVDRSLSGFSVAQCATQMFLLDLDGYNETVEQGKYKVEVTKVNGVDDAYAPNNSCEGVIDIYKENYVRNLFMEEYTGTWCGYCPLGILAADYMKETYPDRFVLAAHHFGYNASNPDAFEISGNYQLLIDCQVEYFPSAYANRLYPVSVDKRYFEAAMAYFDIPAVAELGLDVVYNPDFTKVQVKATSKFALDIDNTDYKIGFMLIENNVQSLQNDYGNYLGLGEGMVLTKLNDITRAIYGLYGQDNSVPASVKAGEVNEYTTELTLPSAKTNKDNLELIACLYRGSTHEVMNVTKAKIQYPSAIASVGTDSALTVKYNSGKFVASDSEAVVNVYTLSGVQVANENVAPGLYVVKASNAAGTVTAKCVAK